MISDKTLKSTAGILLNGMILLSVKLLKKADTSFTGGIIFDVAESVGAQFALKHLDNLGLYNKIYDRLRDPHPDNINHDLERVFKEATLLSLNFIEVLYEEELRNDVAYFGDCNKAEIKTFFRNLSVFFREAKRELKTYLEEQKIEKNLIDTPSTFFVVLSEHLLQRSNISFDQRSRDRLKDYYAQNIPYCFQLAFKEALKNDDKAFKAFEIWMLEELKSLALKTQSSVERIEEKLAALETGVHVITHEQLDLLCQKAIDALEANYVGISYSLERIAEEITRNFEVSYLLSQKIYDAVIDIDIEVKSLQRTVDHLFDVTRRVQVSENMLHQKIDQEIERQMKASDLVKTQRIFAGSEEVRHLIDEIKNISDAIQFAESKYKYYLEKSQLQQNIDFKDLADGYYQKMITEGTRFENQTKRLDEIKTSVMSSYQLLFLTSDVGERSEITQQAIALFEESKFDDLEQLLLSEQREIERGRIFREQALLDEKKKDFSLGDLLAAQIILRNRNAHTETRLNLAEKYFKNSISMYPSFENHFGYAEFLMEIYPQKSLEHYLYALDFLKEYDEKYGDVTFALGNAYINVQNFQTSERYLKIALEFFSNFPPEGSEIKVIVVRVLNNLGTVHQSLKAYQEAADAYTSAYNRLHQLDINTFETEYLRLSIVVNQASLFKATNEFIEADYKLTQAVNFSFDMNEKYDNYPVSSALTVLINAGYFYENISELSKAQANYGLALPLLSKPLNEPISKRTGAETSLMHSLARLFYKMGKLREALPLLYEIIDVNKVFAELGFERFKHGLATAYMNLAVFNGVLGNHKNVLEDFDKAISLYIELADKNPQLYSLEWAHCLVAKADYYISSDQISHAKKDIDQAEYLYSNWGSLDEHGGLLDFLHLKYRFSLVIGDLEGAVRFLIQKQDRLKEIYESRLESYQAEVAIVLVALGDVYRKKGEFSLSLDLLNEAIKIYKKNSAKKFVQYFVDYSLALRYKAKVYLEMKNFEDSEVFMLQSLYVLDNLSESEIADRIETIADMSCERANIKFSSGNFGGSIVLFNNALKTYKNLKSRSESTVGKISYTLHNIGLAFKKLNRKEDESTYHMAAFKEHLNIFRLDPINNWEHLCRFLHFAGDSYLEQRKAAQHISCLVNEYSLLELYAPKNSYTVNLGEYVRATAILYNVGTSIEDNLEKQKKYFNSILSTQ